MSNLIFILIAIGLGLIYTVIASIIYTISIFAIWIIYKIFVK